MPMTYGVVDKAPAVLWTSSEYNIEGSNSYNHIYALTDRFELTRVGNENPESGHNLSSSSSISTRSHVSIFTGKYLWINESYRTHSNSYNYSSLSQYSVSANKVRLRKHYTGETPRNSIAEDIAQITVKRSAISASLLDSSNVSGVNYQGDSEGIFIEKKDLLLTKYNLSPYGNNALSSWDAYAGIPTTELDSLDLSSQETEDGWIQLDEFRNTENLSAIKSISGSASTFRPHQHEYDYDHVFNYDVTDNPGGLNSLINTMLYNLEDVNCEIVALPDSKKLYDMYVEWYVQQGRSASDIRSWSSGNHRWQGTLVEGHNWTMPFFRIHFASGDETYNYILFTETRVETENGVETRMIGASDEELYEDLYNLEWWYENWYGGNSRSTYWDELTEPSDSGNRGDLPATNRWDGTETYEIVGQPWNVQFWTLVEEIGGKFYGQLDEGLDIPRYRINSKEGTLEADIIRYGALRHGWLADPHVQVNTTYTKYLNSYNADWNGISNDIWGNTGQWGGHTEGAEDSAHRKLGYELYPHVRPNLDPANGGCYISNASTFNWNQLYSKEKNWFLHIKENGASVGSNVLPEGLLIPAHTYYFYTPWVSSQPPTNSFNGGYTGVTDMTTTIAYPESFYTTNTAILSESAEDDYIDIRDGSELEDDKRVGIAYSLEDAGVEDSMEGSGVTQFYGKFSYKPLSESTTNEPTVDFKVNFLEADLQEDNLETLESDGVGVLKQETFAQLHASNAERIFDSRTNMSTAIRSYDWANPNDFNAGILRFWCVNESTSNAVAPVNIRLHHLGVQHVVDIEKIFDKDFYVSSAGRQLDGSDSSPLGIIKDIIEKELEISPSIHESYTNYQETGNNWSLGFSITEKINSKILIENIAKSTPYIPYFKSTSQGSSLAFAMIENEYNANQVNKIITTKDVITFSYDRTKIENVKTMFRIKYKKDYARDNFSKVTEYRDAYDLFGNGDYNESPNYYSKEFLGLSSSNPGDSVVEIENEFIRDLAVARRLRDFLTAYHCNQHTIIKCKLPLTYIDLEIADIVSFDKIIQGQKAYGEDYATPTYYIRNGQGIYPYFMVTSVNKSIDSVNIECIQLHKLTPENNIISTGSGDVLRKNGNPNSDDISLLQNYLGGYEKYFTEGQKQNANMSADMSIDDKDLSQLIELVDMLEANATEDTSDDIAEDTSDDIAEDTSDQVIPEISEDNYLGTFTLASVSPNGNWGTITTTQINTVLMGISAQFVNPNDNQNFLEEQEGLDIFRDNPDIWNAGNVVGANNDQILNERTPISNQYYTGSGMSILPSIFVGWHMKIEDEWVRVEFASSIGSGGNINGAYLRVERGLFGTDIVAHSGGQPVEIYNSAPTDDQV